MNQSDLIGPNVHTMSNNLGIMNEAKGVEMFLCHFQYFVEQYIILKSAFILPWPGNVRQTDSMNELSTVCSGVS